MILLWKLDHWEQNLPPCHMYLGGVSTILLGRVGSFSNLLRHVLDPLLPSSRIVPNFEFGIGGREKVSSGELSARNPLAIWI